MFNFFVSSPSSRAVLTNERFLQPASPRFTKIRARNQSVLTADDLISSYAPSKRSRSSAHGVCMFEPLYTRRNLALIVNLCVMSFVVGVTYANFVTFLPNYVIGKETTDYPKSVQVGLIFALYPLAILVSSPLFASLSEVYHTKLYCIGLLIMGVSSILFGILPNIYIKCLCRFLEGIGGAAVVSASLVLVYERFPQRHRQVIRWTEAAAGIGYMIGPLYGGTLYDFSGQSFSLPFTTIGGTALSLLILAPFMVQSRDSQQLAQAYKTLEHIESIRPKNDNSAILGLQVHDPPKHHQRTKLWAMVNKRLLSVAVAAFVVATGFNFLYRGLALHLQRRYLILPEEEEYPYVNMVTGLFYAVPGLLYALAAPLIGTIALKYSYRNAIVFGLGFTTLAFILVGPFPHLEKAIEHQTTLRYGLILLSLVFVGMGYGLVFIPALPDMIDSVSHVNDEHVISFVSETLGIILTLGQVVGPMIGSFTLIHRFSLATFWFGASSLIWVPIFYCSSPRWKRDRPVTELLDESMEVGDEFDWSPQSIT